MGGRGGAVRVTGRVIVGLGHGDGESESGCERE